MHQVVDLQLHRPPRLSRQSSSDWPGIPYIRSSPTRESPRPRQPHRLAGLAGVVDSPQRRNSESRNDCTPKFTRFTPPPANAEATESSNVPGLASTLNSVPLFITAPARQKHRQQVRPQGGRGAAADEQGFQRPRQVVAVQVQFPHDHANEPAGRLGVQRQRIEVAIAALGQAQGNMDVQGSR